MKLTIRTGLSLRQPAELNRGVVIVRKDLTEGKPGEMSWPVGRSIGMVMSLTFCAKGVWKMKRE